MSEGAFRWIIALGVSLCCVMSIASAYAMLAVLRIAKRVEGKVGPVVDKAGPVLDSAKALVDDVRPKIHDMVVRADEITVSARDQVARLDILVTEVSESARLQMERIDIVVSDTVNRVQETTSAVQATILRPVREINGVVSGLRAGLSALGQEESGIGRSCYGGRGDVYLNFVDVHSHILPGLDDGAKSLEDSVEMLRMAVGSGTTDIVASPHADNEFHFDPEMVAKKIEELRLAVNGSIRIHTGCDFHLSFDNIQDSLRNPTKYAINHKRYVLVEFSDLLIPRTTDDVFYQMQAAGMIPVITHPERNMLLQKRIDQLAIWAESGCLVQVTAQSFLGRFGKQAKAFADRLLMQGLAHIVASDAHDTKYRPPVLSEAYAYVVNACGQERAERLFVTNPGAILTGALLVNVEEPAIPAKKWYQIGRKR